MGNCIPNCVRIRCINKNKKYSFPFGKYTCYVQDVVDGDTFHITFLLHSKPITMKLRLQGVDTPEIHGKTDLEKEAAIKIKNDLEKRLRGKFVCCQLHKWDKYGGRIVGTLQFKNIDLSNYLISKKYGKKYEGSKKDEWTQEQLSFICNDIVKN
jgi:endonuclease YncB( thermonuclease family)